MRVFSFIGLMWQIFKHILFSLFSPPSCLSQPQTNFHSKTLKISSANHFPIISKVCSYTLFSLFPQIMQKISKFYLYWGIFEKGLGTLNFVQIFLIFWLGFVPFGLFVIVLALCGNFNMYLGNFHSCSCIAHMLVL